MVSFVKFLYWAGKFGLLIGVVKWANTLAQSIYEASDTEVKEIEEIEEEDEDEDSYDSGPSSSKLQPKIATSQARWDDENGMAQVPVQKGNLWRSTGIVRSGKLYCFIEEVLLMVENGSLLLVDDSDSMLSMKVLYTKIDSGKKCLGYIVGRHGIPWSVKKGVQSGCESEKMQITAVKPVYDVFRPNSKFKKSCPGEPLFVLCFIECMRGALEEQQCEGIPIKLCNVEQGRVSLFSIDNDKVELVPILP